MNQPLFPWRRAGELCATVRNYWYKSNWRNIPTSLWRGTEWSGGLVVLKRSFTVSLRLLDVLAGFWVGVVFWFCWFCWFCFLFLLLFLDIQSFAHLSALEQLDATKYFVQLRLQCLTHCFSRYVVRKSCFHFTEAEEPKRFEPEEPREGNRMQKHQGSHCCLWCHWLHAAEDVLRAGVNLLTRNESRNTFHCLTFWLVL